jgi:hypothetical protein
MITIITFSEYTEVLAAIGNVLSIRWVYWEIEGVNNTARCPGLGRWC